MSSHSRSSITGENGVGSIAQVWGRLVSVLPGISLSLFYFVFLLPSWLAMVMHKRLAIGGISLDFREILPEKYRIGYFTYGVEDSVSCFILSPWLSSLASDASVVVFGGA